MAIVVEGEVAEYPLGVGDVEDFLDKLFSPVGTIEKAAGHCQMKILYFIEMYRDVAFHEVAVAYLVLALS